MGKIYKTLDKDEAKKFVKNMRRKGVLDARKDQKAGVKIGDVKYEKGKKIDGHHKEEVHDTPSQMTDPRNIRFLEEEKHIEIHKEKK